MLENILKLFKREESSKNLAKERLKLVLIHDKANVSPQFLEMVKSEIIKVITKYMEIDEESLDIQLTKTKSDAGDRVVPALVANIPILNVRTMDKLKVDDKPKEKVLETSAEDNLKKKSAPNKKKSTSSTKNQK